MKSKYFFGLIGFLFGIGMQFHYSFIFAIVLGIIWLFLNKKLTIIVALALLLGFVIGFIPVIAYELKSGFYNLRTLLLVFTSPASSQNRFSFSVYYYLISIFPFFFFFLSMFLAKLNRYILLIILGIYIIWPLTSVLQIRKNVLDYYTLRSISAAIEADNPSNFNIVDQLTRDNQAMALRYILTSHGFTPDKEGVYNSANSLYIYSKEPLDNLLKNPIYEIKSFLPYKTVKMWKVGEIFVYKLEK